MELRPCDLAREVRFQNVRLDRTNFDCDGNGGISMSIEKNVQTVKNFLAALGSARYARSAGVGCRRY